VVSRATVNVKNPRSQAASGPRGGEHTSRPADSGSTRRAHARRSAASKMVTDVRGPLVRGTGIESVTACQTAFH
jgi:hypothetical protein